MHSDLKKRKEVVFSSVPVSIQAGNVPPTAPHYYYVYNGYGDVVALADAQGTVAASYNYDAYGQLTSFSENFGGTTTWTNLYPTMAAMGCVTTARRTSTG